MACGPARADDANRFAPVSVHHCQQMPPFRKAQQHEPLFLGRMTGIGQNAAERIAEDRRRLLERDSLFHQIGRSFSLVPLKLQRQIILYVGSLTPAPG